MEKNIKLTQFKKVNQFTKLFYQDKGDRNVLCYYSNGLFLFYIFYIYV